MLNQFIQQHSEKIEDKLNAFYSHELSFSDLEQSVWETLDSWYQLQVPYNAPYAANEQVFWHLIFELHQQNEIDLVSDPALQKELISCISCLCHAEQPPKYCVGVRP